ncbi:MAG: hypothetical protein HQM10_19460 [Candidatus Riflebacteria bacterium]|nr:hypothetical protein [Candidatus Riflebacteria bacterium]
MKSISGRLIRYFTAILLFFFSTFSGFADAQPSLVETDFLDQKITVWGLGGNPWEDITSSEEERARAWTDALHHAYYEVLSLQFMEKITVKQLLHQYPTLNNSLRRTLLGAEKTLYQKDISGLIRCRVEVPFCGKNGIRAALFLASLFPSKIGPRIFRVPVSTETQKISASDTPYSRIIVDLRDCIYKPALFPRFFDINGNLLFQESTIPAPERFSRPVIKYSSSMASATEDVEDGKIFYASARTAHNHESDITIIPPDDDEFKNFAAAIASAPLRELDIFVVYDSEKKLSGLIPQKKEAAKTAKKEKSPTK